MDTIGRSEEGMRRSRARRPGNEWAQIYPRNFLHGKSSNMLLRGFVININPGHSVGGRELYGSLTRCNQSVRSLGTGTQRRHDDRE